MCHFTEQQNHQNRVIKYVYDRKGVKGVSFSVSSVHMQSWRR